MKICNRIEEKTQTLEQNLEWVQIKMCMYIFWKKNMS